MSLVAAVDGYLAERTGVVEGFNVVGSPSAALVVIGEVLHLAGRELAFIKFHVANDAPHQAVLIFAVQNLKGVGQAGFPGVHAQNTVTYSVKCANPEAFGTHVKQLADPAAHFTGRLVGKGTDQKPHWAI